MPPKRLAAAAIAATLAAAAPAAATEDDSFRQIASLNIPGGIAEIVSATPDGRTLVYTDASGEAVGIVDISSASRPEQVARIDVPGEPTSVAVTEDGTRALVVVKTSALEEGAPPQITPGRLLVIDLASRAVVQEVAIGNGPDSVATIRVDGVDVAVVAIENEPIVVDAAGNQTDDEDPGLPGDVSGPGLVQVVALEAAGPRVVDVPLALEGDLLFPDDPQPEFVSIRGTTAAVTLQENNGVAILDIEAALAGSGDAVTRIFGAGTAGDRPADLADDATISFTDRFPADSLPDEPGAGARTPDSIAWSADGTVVYTADEGEQDLTGSRGWSGHDPRTGRLVYEERGLERIAARFGHYPDSRSEAKGIEVEGLATAVIDGRRLAFVGSERGSFLAVYDVSRPRSPRFAQLLPTGVEPEGILPIPARNLVVTAAEATGNLTIFRAVDARPAGTPQRPQISSSGPGTAWAALSGLAADPSSARVLWSVPDDALPSELYRIEVKGGTAALTSSPIRRDGAQARYDLEGIAVDTSSAARAARGGFWVASEGNAAFGEDGYTANLLIQVGRRGDVLREIPLPPAIDSPAGGVVRSNGYEGVAVSDDGGSLLAAIQREYASDAVIGGVRHTRIARYDLASERWEFFLYPLDAPPPGATWVGLSEIVNLGGDRYAVIERDNAAGAAAAVKRVYEFTLDGVAPTDGAPLAAGADVAGRVIEKTLLRDVLEETAPFEKVEGLAVTRRRTLWSVVDNDGGLHESRLSDLGVVR